MRTILKTIITFGIIMAFAVFGFLFVQSLISENLLEPIATPLKDFSTSMNLDPRVNAGIDEAVGFYNDLGLKVDLLFLISWIAMEVFVVSLALKIPKLPTFNFLSYLLFGTMLLMFILDMLTQITTWLTTNLINGIFDPSATYLPVFNFYQTYQYIIVFLNFIMVLVVNVVLSKKEQTQDALDFNNPQPMGNMSNAQEVIEE